MSPGEDLPRAEDDALPARRLWRTAVIALVVAVAAVFASGAILAQRAPHTAYARTPARARAEIGMVEQTLILDTARGVVERDAQRESLEHFGWSDRAHGIAKIPVDRAIDLVADPAFMRRAFAAKSPDAGSVVR